MAFLQKFHQNSFISCWDTLKVSVNALTSKGKEFQKWPTIHEKKNPDRHQNLTNWSLCHAPPPYIDQNPFIIVRDILHAERPTHTHTDRQTDMQTAEKTRTHRCMEETNRAIALKTVAFTIYTKWTKKQATKFLFRVYCDRFS